jgi:hypothetical protein
VTANPLVVGPVDTSTAFGGAMLLDSLSQLSASLESGDWVASGLAGVGVALDAVATAVDPLGSLIAAGLGWLMEHLEPLKGWLNDLTGDAGAVLGFAGTWDNVASAMTGAGDELHRIVTADLEAMSGASIVAYGAYANGLADRVRAAGSSASSMASALRTCSTVVQVVHDLVRDTLAQLVGSIISWVSTLVMTAGLATPYVASQVATRVSSIATRVGRSVIDVISTGKSLKNLLEAMKDALAQLASGVRGAVPGARGVSNPGRVPNVPTVKPQSLDDIRAWLDKINPGFTGDPFDPRSVNCGNCTAAVHSTLRGGPLGEADTGTLSIPQMEKITGLPQVTMTPVEIADALKAGGPGSHAVIGIDRAQGPGHWFNAYYDGTKVVAVDGQSGQIIDWPPSYGAVHWDAAIRRAR